MINKNLNTKNKLGNCLKLGEVALNNSEKYLVLKFSS
tara:strand:+ start:1745 stop:1855 length:111 start_codon:yes stop_codon:yes gene_type:complete